MQFNLPKQALQIHNIQILTQQELIEATTISKKDLLFPCYGCASAVNQFISQNCICEGLLIGDFIQVQPCFQDAESIRKLLFLHLKSQYQKPLKRCQLHSLKVPNLNLLQIKRTEIPESLFTQSLQHYIKRKKFCQTCRDNICNCLTLLKDCTCHKEIRIDQENIIIEESFVKRLILKQENNTKHANSKEDAQNELLTCLGILLRERLGQEYKQKEEDLIIKRMFLFEVCELYLQQIQQFIQSKVNSLEQYLQQEEINKERNKRKRQARKFKQRKQLSPDEITLLKNFGWESESISPSTRNEIQQMRLQIDRIALEKQQLQEQIQQRWSEWSRIKL